MVHILVDFENLFERCRYAYKPEKGKPIADTIIDIFFSTLSHVWNRFESTHVILCGDDNSWRSDFYPLYKSKKRLQDEPSSLEELRQMKEISNLKKDLWNFFENQSYCTTLKGNKLEADDLISCWCQIHREIPKVIVSADKDLQQMLDSHTVIFDHQNFRYRTIEKCFRANGEEWLHPKTKLPAKELDPIFDLFERCVRGNHEKSIWSAYPGVRTARLRVVYKAIDDPNGYVWTNFMMHKWKDHHGVEHTVGNDFKRNRTLLDLRAQPKEIVESMHNVCAHSMLRRTEDRPGMLLRLFFARWKCEDMMAEGLSAYSFITKRYRASKTESFEPFIQTIA